MKILQLGKWNENSLGGIEYVQKMFSESLNDIANIYTSIVFENTASESKLMSYELASRPFSVIYRQPLSLRYIYYIIKEINKYDLVIVHAPNLIAFLSVLMSGYRNKLIVYWHSDVLNIPVGKLFTWLEHKILKKSDLILCSTVPYCRHSSRVSKYSDKICELKIGVNRASAYNVSNALQKNILFIGRLVDYKSVDVLVKSAKYISKEINIHIVGNGPNDKLLKEFVDNNSITNVHLHGAVEDEEKERLLKTCDVFVLPSKDRREAYGIVLVEAMAHGMALITSNMQGSGVNVLNENMKTGLNFEIGNARSLADAITSIYSDHDRLELFKKNSHEKYCNELSEIQMKKEIRDIINYV